MSLNTIVIIVNIMLIFSIVFLERKKASEMIAWILVLAAIPILGFVLYILFGDTIGMRLSPEFIKKSEADREYQEKLVEQQGDLLSGRKHFRSPRFSAHDDMIAMHINQSESTFTEDNHVQLLIDGPAKFDALFADVENAKHHIHIEYFIFKHDDLGKKLINLLAKKASEGVEVRLIYDALGALKTRRRHFAPIVEAGGEVQRFLPSYLYSVLRMNYRQHRKNVVIDGLIAYTGGINVGDEYLGKNPKRFPWRDTSIRITGQAVQMMQLKFSQDWMHILQMNTRSHKTFDFAQAQYFPAPVETGEMGVQIVTSGPDAPQQEIRDGYIKMINAARSTLYIQTPYLIPDESFITSLKLAAASGVDVKIMIPGVPDKWYVYKVTMSYAGDMLNNGISIFLHEGFLHSKTIVMDDEVTSIGTTNADIRSFALDFELNAFVYDKTFARQNRDQFEKDLQDCTELTLDAYRKRGFWEACIECLLRPFGPLM